MVSDNATSFLKRLDAVDNLVSGLFDDAVALRDCLVDVTDSRIAAVMVEDVSEPLFDMDVKNVVEQLGNLRDNVRDATTVLRAQVELARKIDWS